MTWGTPWASAPNVLPCAAVVDDRREGGQQFGLGDEPLDRRVAGRGLQLSRILVPADGDDDVDRLVGRTLEDRAEDLSVPVEEGAERDVANRGTK